MKTINPQNLPLISYKELVPFQDNLKDLDTEQHDKLLASLNKYGFFVPAFVWINDGKYYILDSHQRHRVLMLNEIKFENTGYEIPYVAIAAKDEKEAKEKLLVITSQYGKITREGLDEFAALAEIEVDDLPIHFDAIVDFEAEGLEPDDEPEPKEKVTRYTIDQLKDLRNAFAAEKGMPDNGFVDWLEKRPL